MSSYIIVMGIIDRKSTLDLDDVVLCTHGGVEKSVE